MGTIYKATCSCGFEHFKLLQGHGINGVNNNFEIFQCDGCHTFFNYELSHTVDSLFAPLPCPDCKARLVRLDSDPEQHEYTCPECHEPMLAMSVIQYWD